MNVYEVPGWITCSTDTNSLQHAAGSELLDRPLRVEPNKESLLIC